MDNNQKELEIITKTFEFMKYLVERTEKFPKSQRFIIGKKIQDLIIEIFEKLIEARYTKNRFPLLKETNLALEKLRYFLRLACEMKYISINQFNFTSQNLMNIGSQIGGWIKSINGGN